MPSLMNVGSILRERSDAVVKNFTDSKSRILVTAISKTILLK